MNTGRTDKQTICLCRDTGGKGTLPASAQVLTPYIKLPPNQKGKGPERKDSRVMAQNVYITIHSVTYVTGGIATHDRMTFMGNFIF